MYIPKKPQTLVCKEFSLLNNVITEQFKLITRIIWRLKRKTKSWIKLNEKWVNKHLSACCYRKNNQWWVDRKMWLDMKRGYFHHPEVYSFPVLVPNLIITRSLCHTTYHFLFAHDYIFSEWHKLFFFNLFIVSYLMLGNIHKTSLFLFSRVAVINSHN